MPLIEPVSSSQSIGAFVICRTTCWSSDKELMVIQKQLVGFVGMYDVGQTVYFCLPRTAFKVAAEIVRQHPPYIVVGEALHHDPILAVSPGRKKVSLGR